MAVVKADGYGHGLVPAARAVLAGGADCARRRRPRGGAGAARGRHHRAAAGLAARPGHRLRRRRSRPTSRSRSTPTWALDEVVAAARATGRPARLHLFVDTGLSRGGRDAGRLARPGRGRGPRAGRRRDRGGRAVEPHGLRRRARPIRRSRAQVRVFEEAVALARARRADRRPPAPGQLRGHGRPAATPGTTSSGRASPLYGLDPLGGNPADHGLRPAMTVRAPVALTKRVPAGVGVSYGHTYVTDRETTLALVPVGYADGVPRAAGNRAPVLAAGAQRTIAGRVCMDQFVLDVGDAAVEPGDDGRPVGSGRPRRADGAAVGRRRRHHPLRAGHPGRWPVQPPVRRLGGAV